MSVYVSTWVWRETTAQKSDLLVLLALADAANDDGWCFPGIESLVDKTRLGRSTLFKRLDVLESAELIERYRRGTMKTTVYRVCVPWSDASSWPEDLRMPEGVKSRIETGVKSRIGTSEVPPAGPVKSHGRDTEPSEETSVKRQTARESFEEFWDLYPRKIRKGEARDAFRKAVKVAPAGEIIDGLRRQLPVLLGTEERYVPHPTSWLNAQRWADVPAAQTRSAWDRAVPPPRSEDDGPLATDGQRAAAMEEARRKIAAVRRRPSEGER